MHEEFITVLKICFGVFGNRYELFVGPIGITFFVKYHHFTAITTSFSLIFNPATLSVHHYTRSVLVYAQ